MFRLDAELKVFVHREAIDFRKSINGLSVLVEQSMKLDPFARAVYAFTNRRRDRVKLLLYERTGFWLLMKRLEADRFAWPRTGEIVGLSVEQLHWLLDGIDLSAMRKHPERRYARA
jgi:transposase